MNAVLQQPPVQAAIFRSAMYEVLSLALAYPTLSLRGRLDDAIDDLLELPEVATVGYTDDLTRMRDALAASAGGLTGA